MEFLNVVRVHPDSLRVTYTRVRGFDMQVHEADCVDWPEVFAKFPVGMWQYQTRIRVSLLREFQAEDNHEVSPRCI